MEKCIVCKSEFVATGISTGYGLDNHGHKICFNCCGLLDSRNLSRMPKKDKYLLYFNGIEVTNWPGSLKIKPYCVNHGKHNIARTMTTVWFKFYGMRFIGKNYGDNSQILHVKKIA
ncbi:MAG: hypothetical protein KKC77_19300 [Proteobacteria bacterium]|nr:hypothetical protein [Pseudomonadota bacterium]